MDKSDKQFIISMGAYIGVLAGIVTGISIMSNQEDQRLNNLSSKLSEDAKIEQITLDKAEYYVKGDVENSKSPFFIVFYGKGGDVEYKITYNVDEKTYAKLVDLSGKSSKEYSEESLGHKGVNKILRGIIDTYEPVKTSIKTYEDVIEYNVETGDLKEYKLGIDKDFGKLHEDDNVQSM